MCLCVIVPQKKWELDSLLRSSKGPNHFMFQTCWWALLWIEMIQTTLGRNNVFRFGFHRFNSIVFIFRVDIMLQVSGGRHSTASEDKRRTLPLSPSLGAGPVYLMSAIKGRVSLREALSLFITAINAYWCLRAHFIRAYNTCPDAEPLPSYLKALMSYYFLNRAITFTFST